MSSGIAKKCYKFQNSVLLFHFGLASKKRYTGTKFRYIQGNKTFISLLICFFFCTHADLRGNTGAGGAEISSEEVINYYSLKIINFNLIFLNLLQPFVS